MPAERQPMGSAGTVMMLVTSSVIAGAQRQVHDLSVALQERGWRVVVVSLLPLDHVPGDEMFAKLPERGIPTHSLGMRQGVPDPRAMRRLRRLVREIRPHILHAHMIHAILLARVTRLSTRVPVLISTMHNQHQGSSWRYRAYRWTDRLSDLTTTVSQTAMEDTLRAQAVPNRGRITVMHNGVDTHCFRPDDARRTRARRDLGVDGRFTWLAAGRLTEAKDYPTMLQAVAALPAEPDMRLLIAGVGELEAEIRTRIGQLGLEERVALLGLRSDIADLMQGADGFVMSSAWEGLPMVLLEAAASGLPIVATDVGGSREAIVDGETGHIMPPGDAAALSSAMLRVMELSADQRGAMAHAAREHVVKTFDLEAVADRWDGIYRALLPVQDHEPGT